jgi:aspartate carbamoyltransferase catalytic subunit
MKHLLGIDELSPSEIKAFLDHADHYAAGLADDSWDRDALKDKVILNLFFENSTRTLTSFEMAAKRLGARVINWNAQTSSLAKGESFMDTIMTLNAYRPDAVVIRHSEFGAPVYVAKRMDCPVINGGDSHREHPTQALLDALTMRQHFGSLEGLTVAIIGDIAHSRVAHSNMILLSKMGATPRIIAPDVLMPEKLPVDGIATFDDLEEGLDGADVVMTIRPQKERMDKVLINDMHYFEDYGLTHEKLAAAKPNAIVMDPGPFLRNVQISDALADDQERFIYYKQVANGVPTRMAVLDMLVNQK